MRRGLAVTAACVGVACAAAFLLGPPAMSLYLALWLVFLALPAGALPLVMGLELAGCGGAAQAGFLRRMLVLMPAAALASLPVLLALPGLIRMGAPGQGGFAAAWFATPWPAVRGAAILFAWTVLSVACLRPPAAAPRVALCGMGLALHAVLVTLAATDWIMALSPGLNSAALGVLLLAAQCGLALSAALLLSLAPPQAAALLLAASGIWGVLHLTHYLVIWSADKPAEITWYLQRTGALGSACIWLGAAAWLTCMALFGSPLRRVRFVVPACAALLLLAHAMEMVWLVLPSLRGAWLPNLGDAAGAALLALICAAMAWAWRPRAAAA